MHIFSKTFWKTIQNTLSHRAILIMVFICTLNISSINNEGIIGSNKAMGEETCYGGNQCVSSCMPLSLGFTVDVIQVVSPQRARFCIQMEAMGYSWYSAEIKSVTGPYVPLTVCGCGMPDQTAGCNECSNKCTTDTLTSAGYSIDFWSETNMWHLGWGYCGCTTDIITVPIALPDTTIVDSTIASELGPPDLCEAVVSEPINVTNGNVFREEKDATISSSRGLPIEFVRSYNSFSLYSGTVGHGWRHSYECSLDKDQTTGNITLKEGSGRELIFKYYSLYDTSTQESSFVYLRPYGMFYQLEFDTTDSGYTITKQDDTKWHFDSWGKLLYIADRNDNRITLTYSSDTLKTITNASGRRLILEYNQYGLIDTLKDGAGRVLVTYDGNKVIHHVSDSKADTTTYTYSVLSTCSNCITKIENSDGEEYNYEYDGYGRVISSSQKNDVNRISLSYTCRTGSCPRISTETKITDSDNNTSIYSSFWDPTHSRRLLKKVEDPGCGGCYVELGYGPNGKIIHKEYENGVIDSFTYDMLGNLVKEIRAANNSSLKQTTWNTYLSDFHLPISKKRLSIVNPADTARVNYTYDSNGNLEKVIEIGKVDASTWYYDTTTYTYNNYGQLTKINGPRSDAADSTVFTYDTLWQELASVIQYVSDTFLITTYSNYDSLGNPQLITDPNGVKTRYFYDGYGKIFQVINGSTLSDSTMTQYTYNSSGNVKQITLPKGNTIKYNYDFANRLVSIVNGVNDSLKYTYDTESRLTKKEIRNASGVLTWKEEYDYDDQKDLLTKIIDPLADTTFFRYDLVVNRVFQRDAKGDSITYRYDDLNRLTTVIQWKDGDSLKTNYTYDSMDNLRIVTDADNNVTSYKYSDKRFLTEDSSSVTGITRYQYDPAGNLIKKKDSQGDSILYSYDALNRLTQIGLQTPSQNIKYFYDGSSSYRKGRLYKEETPYDTITYSYKFTGLLSQEDKKTRGITYTTKYNYDKNGNLLNLTYPKDRILTYYYDNADRVDSLRGVYHRVTTRFITNLDYAPYGGPTSLTYGNGIITTIKYNQRYWIDSLVTNTNTIKRRYSYDKVGNITKISDLLYPVKSESLYYDPLSRLVVAVADTFPGDTIRYEYSNAGNRLKKIIGTDTTFYHYSANKLDSTTGNEPAIYRYDNKGNVVMDSTTVKDTLVYEQLNRLISINPGVMGKYYYYDGEGKRIRKDFSNIHYVYLYDQWGNLIGEVDTSGNFICDYIWANGKLVAKVYPKGGIEPTGGGGMVIEGGGPPPIPLDSELVFYYHLDHLGTPLALTAKNQDKYWFADYLPFGEIYNELIAGPSNDVRFPGQYHDLETGLYYNWHRYYKPTLGRYYQADPLSKKDQIEEFNYVHNNPLIFSDPLGLYIKPYVPNIPLSSEDENCIKKWVSEYKVSYHLYKCIIWAESTNDPSDPNPSQATPRGALAQCKQDLPCFKGINNRCDSFRCGAYYLQYCTGKFPGDLSSVIKCYRGGENSVRYPEKYPSYQGYIKFVMNCFMMIGYTYTIQR